MKLIDDIRRDNLAEIAGSLGGPAALARLLDRTESQVSQWINGSLLPSGKRRGMKSETARWIEQKTGQVPGWLDREHGAPGDKAAEPLAMPYIHPVPIIRQVIALMESTDEAGRGAILYAATLALEKVRPVKETAG